MSRQKIHPFPPWQTTTPNGEERRGYIRVGSIMETPEFIELSSNAKVLYLYMLKSAGGNRDFEFPKTKYEKLMTPPTFRRARDELIKAGFIDLVQYGGNLRMPNEYRFSTRWRGFEQG